MYEQELKAYYKQVGKRLPGGAAQRAAYETYLMNSAEEILHDLPGATFAEVQSALGTPEEITEAYLSTLPPQQIEAWARRKKHRRLLVGVLIGLLIAVLAGLVIYYYCVRGVVTVSTTIINYPDGMFSSLADMPTASPVRP